MAGKWLANLSVLLLTSCSSSLHVGDLLFHVTKTGNAITDVTPGMIDHVAIVLSRDSVIEAVGAGVRTTPLDSLRSQEGYYIIGKVRRADPTLSVINARCFLGRPYDRLYLPDNEAIYCSELVLFSMVDHRGNHLLQPVPMSFHDASGHITPYWQQFYRKHGMEVPEGWPGSNPGELSQRHEVRLKGKLL
jgi:hypothetical protein